MLNLELLNHQEGIVRIGLGWGRPPMPKQQILSDFPMMSRLLLKYSNQHNQLLLCTWLSSRPLFSTSSNTSGDPSPSPPLVTSEVKQYSWPRYTPHRPKPNDRSEGTAGDLCKKLRSLAKSEDIVTINDLDEVAHGIARKAGELDPYAIANAFCSCKMMKYSNPLLIDALANRVMVSNLCEEFDAIQIGMTIQSLGALSRNPVRSYGLALGKDVKLMCILLANQLCLQTDLNNQVLANVVHGLGNIFRVGKGRKQDRAVLECLESISAEACKPSRLGEYTGQALSNLVYGWALIGWTASPTIWVFADEVVQESRLRHFTSQEFCNILYGLGQLGFFDRDVVTKLSMEAIEPHRLRKLNHKELCIVVQGLAQCVQAGGRSNLQLELNPVMRKLRKEVDQIERLKQYNTTDLGMLIYGWGILDTESADSVSEYITRFVGTSRGGAIPKEDLTKVLLTCVRLDLHHPSFLKVAKKSIDSDAITLNSSFAITLVLWCLSGLGALNRGLFFKLCRRLVELRKHGEELSLQSCVQLSQVVSDMGVYRRGGVLDQDLQSLFSEAMSRQKGDAVPFRDLLAKAIKWD